MFPMITFTLPAFLLSLVLSILAAPAPLNNSSQTTTLSPRTTHYGRGTWFYPGVGNCGWTNVNTDLIVAISVQIYGAGDNCGQGVEITNTDNGQTAYAQVVDSCESCDEYSLDMSPETFEQLAPLSVGDISIAWHYMARA